MGSRTGTGSRSIFLATSPARRWPSPSTALAVEQGKGKPFRNAAHRAFFVEGLDISDDAVLREAAREAGLDADAALEAAWDPTGLAALRSAREEALRLGVHGVPTVAAAEEVLFYGAAEPGRLRHMLVKESGTR
jgi:predicted DsbA family dithiol-disulfide isomerase